MTTLAQIETWPDQAPIDAVRLTITGAYEYRQRSGANGPYTVQNADATDVAGKKIRLSVWNHPDITPLKGKEVIVASTAQRGGKLGGVKVKHGSYKHKTTNEVVNTVEIEVSKGGTFQFVEVYQAHNPSAATETALPAPATAKQGQTAPNVTEGRSSGIRPIHGATVGMAINQACADLIARGEPLEPKAVFETASGLVRVALHMEAGNLFNPKAEKTPEQEPEKGPPSQEPLDEDVPF